MTCACFARDLCAALARLASVSWPSFQTTAWDDVQASPARGAALSLRLAEASVSRSPGQHGRSSCRAQVTWHSSRRSSGTGVSRPGAPPEAVPYADPWVLAVIATRAVGSSLRNRPGRLMGCASVGGEAGLEGEPQRRSTRVRAAPETAASRRGRPRLVRSGGADGALRQRPLGLSGSALSKQPSTLDEAGVRGAEPQAAAGRCRHSAHVTAPCGAPGELLPGSSAAFALRGAAASRSDDAGRGRRGTAPELTHRQRLRAGEVGRSPRCPSATAAATVTANSSESTGCMRTPAGNRSRGFRAIFASIRSSSQ
jgi:hypothetical protein